MFLKKGTTSMSDDLLAGIDCGATKVMVQSGAYCSKTSKISPGSIYHELHYSDHPGWNFNFKPIPLNIQITHLSY